MHAAAVCHESAISTACIQHDVFAESMVNTLHGKQEMLTSLSNRCLTVEIFNNSWSYCGRLLSLVNEVNIIYVEPEAATEHMCKRS